MSTPPGKSPSSIGATTSVSHQTHERADVERCRIDDEIIRDLERLLASVRSVQREESATQRSHAAQLPPVPERPVPPAMSSRSDYLSEPLLILIVSIFAVLTAIYFWMEGGGPSSKQSTGQRMAAVESKSITSLPPSSSSQEDSRTNIDQDYARGEVTTEPPELSQRADSSTVAMLRRDSLTTQAPPPGTHVRVLDPEGITFLMKQGEELQAMGDVVTARMVFQRVAEAGDANAAIAVGTTYDPIFFAKLGVVGINADIAQARSWYEKAERLGSPEARRLLDLLANR